MAYVMHKCSDSLPFALFNSFHLFMCFNQLLFRFVVTTLSEIHSEGERAVHYIQILEMVVQHSFSQASVCQKLNQQYITSYSYLMLGVCRKEEWW